MRIDDILGHFGPHNEAEILEFAHRLFTHYIFISSESFNGFSEYYCTACSFKGLVEPQPHKSFMTCPSCKEAVEVRLLRYKKSRLIQQGYFIRFENSILDNSLIARGIYIVWDLSKDITSKPIFEDKERFLLTKKPLRISMPSIWYDATNQKITHWQHYDEWQIANRIREGFGYFSQRSMAFRTTDIDSFKISDPGELKYNGWSYHRCDDILSYLALYIRFPVIEYFAKFGLHQLISLYMAGEPTYNTIDWNGKTIEKVFGFSKKDIKLICENAGDITFNLLRQLKDGNISDLTNKLWCVKYLYSLDLATFSEYTTYADIRKYLDKQLEKLEDSDEYDPYTDPYNEYEFPKTIKARLSHIATDWKDYLIMAKKLGYNMKDRQIIMPKKLMEAHNRAQTLINISISKELKDKFNKRYKELSKFTFQHKDILVFPPKTPIELKYEGRRLSHCVATYADRHANGTTSIFFVRKADSPNTPYFTLEIVPSGIKQCRGYKNCSYGSDIEEVINLFNEKFNSLKKSKKQRIKLPA